MLYAHVTNGTVDAVGMPPLLIFSQGRWYDLRNRDINTLIQVGWYPVDETARPGDTATKTWDATYVADPLGQGPVDQVWVQRDKTPTEVQDEQIADGRAQMLADLRNGINAIIAARTAAQNDIATATTLKSQADTLSGQIQTSINQWQSSTPSTNIAYITALRDAIVLTAQRQKQIVDANAAMYVYRKAVNENAVTTDNSLLWLARVVSDQIIDV
jgi:hypothetical protein